MAPPRRVLHVTASGMLGGAERVLLDLLAWQKREESAWEPSLLVLEPGPLVDMARSLRVPVATLPLPEKLATLGESGRGRGAMMVGLSQAAAPAWRYLRDLREQVSRVSPQTVHSHSLKTHVLLALSGIGRARLLWHMHDYVGARHTSAWLLRALARRCQVAVANSKSVAADVKSTLPTLSVSTVLNGVDLAALSAAGPPAPLDELSALPPAAPDVIRVGLLSTFARWKGHEVFLRALATLPAERVRGYVIGAPVYQTHGSQYSRAELEALVASLGLTGRVGFPGFVADRAACLRALDVVVHASTEPEPFGLVIAEAMAAGRAVVMSTAGGAGELVVPGHDALTHTTGDPRSLAAAIERLVESPELRAQLASCAQQSARTRFSIDRFGREIEHAYWQAGSFAQAA